MFYRIKNWDHFQHYRDRNPPWIKLHFKILSSSDWVTLDDASRVLAIACMLIASHNKGIIDGSEVGLAYLKRVAYLNKPPNLKPLISCGFLTLLADASTLQANDTQETETYKERHIVKEEISDPISDQRPETRAANTEKKKSQSKTAIPPDFTISEAVKVWATEHGHNNLEAHLESFRDYALSSGKQYSDWDAGFRRAIRENWGKITPPPPDEPGEFDHLPRINNDDYWICGCPKASTDVCRSPVHGMTLEESCQFNAQAHP